MIYNLSQILFNSGEDTHHHHHDKDIPHHPDPYDDQNATDYQEEYEMGERFFDLSYVMALVACGFFIARGIYVANYGLFNTNGYCRRTHRHHQTRNRVRRRTTKFKTHKNELNDDLLIECAICLEHYDEEDDIVVLPCHHYYHKDCLEEWIAHNGSCPMCRLIV